MSASSMLEAHFCGITSHSSIYGLKTLSIGQGIYKILVASSKRTVYSIEYSAIPKNVLSVIFSTKEVQFTYIPGRAEIISIDAFKQVGHVHDYVIGITFSKNPQEKKRKSELSSSPSSQNSKSLYYFNVYSEPSPRTEFDLDSISQGCFSLSLDFVPFLLTHSELYADEEKEVKEMVWLLSGSDVKMHLYREDKSRQTYVEQPAESCFPEFADLSSVVICCDIICTEEKRQTAYGCRDGFIILTVVKYRPETYIESSWKIQHDGPISSLHMFTDSNLRYRLQKSHLEKLPDQHINLLVGNTIETSVIYRDIFTEGLKLTSQRELPNSNSFDCVACSLAADIDMDGSNEILLGTYGQMLLVYKQIINSDGNESYKLIDQKRFPNPLLALDYVDITGDGLKELLVLTAKGLHIMQHDLVQAAELCLSRMNYLVENVSQETMNEFLQLGDC